MPDITDPSDGLPSLQTAIRRGEIALQRGEVDPNLYVHLDHPNGELRVSYVRLEGKTVTALAIIIMAEPYEGERCFGIGYAVPKKYRNQGRAKDVVAAAIAEFQSGMARNGIPLFYIEAVVGADNHASKRVSEQLISDTPKATTDAVSGIPAFAYVRKIDGGEASAI